MAGSLAAAGTVPQARRDVGLPYFGKGKPRIDISDMSQSKQEMYKQMVGMGLPDSVYTEPFRVVTEDMKDAVRHDSRVAFPVSKLDANGQEQLYTYENRPASGTMPILELKTLPGQNPEDEQSEFRAEVIQVPVSHVGIRVAAQDEAIARNLERFNLAVPATSQAPIQSRPSDEEQLARAMAALPTPTQPKDEPMATPITLRFQSMKQRIPALSLVEQDDLLIVVTDRAYEMAEYDRGSTLNLDGVNVIYSFTFVDNGRRYTVCLKQE